MIRVKWDIEELVALIDIYRRSSSKSNDEIKSELSELSQILQKRADHLGIRHDEKFRNMSGMAMMYENVVYVATKGQKGMSAASNAMYQVFEMSQTCPDVFDLILKEFRKKYC